ncbi:F-box-like protein [Ceratobasidium theobromae]|uniref:F-box-like protein n=1 Tax=Ceratobasidium theobromae TaxID=1582974 RepID=A0A5N5QLE6_9AGAM|nr:F-box-like protein [Ceratobasidium theobromae]
MNSLERIPTEVLIQCLAYLPGHDLINVLSVSSTLRAVAAQDLLWEGHCDRIYNKGSSEVVGWRPIHELGMCNEQNKLSYHLLWRRLALAEPYLGWWLSLDESSAGIIMRIWLDDQRLVVSHIIPVTGPTSSTIPQVLAIRNTMNHIFALSSHDNFLNPLFIDTQSVILEQWSTQSVQWLYEGPSRIMHSRYTSQSFHASNKSTKTSSTQLPALVDLAHSFNWPFRNSPSLFNVVRHSGVLYDDQGYAIATRVPTISLPRTTSHRAYVSIHSPFEVPEFSQLIAQGTWVASYGDSHGWEFIYIHLRKIDERDLSGQWGDERNLGSVVAPDAQDVQHIFNLPTISSPVLTSEDLKIGKTIIEAIKITGSCYSSLTWPRGLRLMWFTGDVNVPRGVRTFVGFIDHKQAWSGPSENGDFLPRPDSHPWPLLPGSDIQRGTPAAALPASLDEMKAQDRPARGITMPGLMRVSDTGFLDPKWANATVHIANRREIRVMLIDGHHVTTFFKVDKSMFELMT